jgi:hypothetical protein
VVVIENRQTTDLPLCHLARDLADIFIFVGIMHFFGRHFPDDAA